MRKPARTHELRIRPGAVDGRIRRVMTMDIYERITERLKAKGMTRKDLCEATGLSYSTLSSLFQRQSRNMRLETIRAIAAVLSVSVDFLVLGREPDMVAEAEGPAYATAFEETEIARILPGLSKRSRTILLAKAYELQEKERDERIARGSGERREDNR